MSNINKEDFMLQSKEVLAEALYLQHRALDKAEELNGVYRDKAKLTDQAIECLRLQVSMCDRINKVQNENLESLRQEISSLKGGVT